MNNSIKLAIEHLYFTFKKYSLEDLTEISCFDFGPTTEELAGIWKDLRDISTKVIDGMEFFQAGWDSWGTQNEVKYFLPRLLECIAEDIDRLEDPGNFSLFKYKLQNCFSILNTDWLEEEKKSLRNFFDAFLVYHLSKLIEIGLLIECVLALNMSPEYILNGKVVKNFIKNK